MEMKKAAPRACPVEATGMPKGITHVTPPRHENAIESVMCRASPYRTITSLPTGCGDIISHSLGTYKPPFLIYAQIPKSVTAARCGENLVAKISSRRLLERLLEGGDHAGDARLHLADGRGGNPHFPRHLRAAFPGFGKPAVYLPRLLGKRRLRKDMVHRSHAAHDSPVFVVAYA